MKIKFLKHLVLLLSTAFILQNNFAQVKKTSVKRPVAVKKVTKPVMSKTKMTQVKITTDSGVIIVKLYDSTPLHRDNFLKLVKEGFYDSLLFHRVIPGFMIQGGDPLSKNAEPGSRLGNGGSDMERIPAEFRRSLIHKKGALSAARDGNPAKASSACQFYIVEGKKMTNEELNLMETAKSFKYSPAQRAAYINLGGTPFLDMDYTVFGEVVSGLEVISKISGVQKDGNDRPLTDVHMKMELMK